MISTVTNDKCYEFRGTSSDFNSIKNNAEFNAKVGNGSIFFVMDDVEVYMFDEEASEWVKL